jgi:hypothetical protein
MTATGGIRRLAASRRGRVAAALVMVGGLALAGCSGGPPASKRPFAAYRQCLQQHGVKPRRGRGATSSTEAGSGATTSTTVDPAAFAAARQACRGLRPAGGLRGGGINSGARSAFRKCMADHGVTLPTFGPGGAGGPGTSGGAGSGSTTTENALGGRGGMLRGLDRHDPNVAAALRSCRSFLGTGSSTTTTK